MTDDVRDAIAAERAAKERLPADSRGLILIMAEIGRGGMNHAVIAIEEARGALADGPGARDPASPSPAGRSDDPALTRRSGATLRATSRVRSRPAPSACPRPPPPEDRQDRAASCRHRPAVGRQGRRPRHPVVGDLAFDGPARRARPPSRRRAPGPRRLPGAHRQALRDGPGRVGRPAGRAPAGRRRRRSGDDRPRGGRPGRGVGRATARRSGRPLARDLADAARRRRRPRRRRGARRASWSPGAWSRAPTTRSRSIAARRRPPTSRPRRSRGDWGDIASPPILDELILVAPGGDAAALTAAAERGVVMGEGANLARTLSNRAANDVSPAVLADEARAHRRAARPVDRRHRAGARDRARDGHVHGRRSGQRQPAADDRHALRRARGERDALGSPPRDRRQGRLLRLGRHQHQAIRPDGRDEDGQDRCVHGHRRDRRRSPGSRPGTPLLGVAAGRREHARPALDPSRRRRHRAQRQDGRHHQHRRRGPAHPGRRDDLGGAPRRDPPRRRGDADRRRRARARAPRDRRLRDAAGLLRRGRRGRAPGPASATGSCR